MQPDEEKSRAIRGKRFLSYQPASKPFIWMVIARAIMSHAKAHATGFLWPYPSMASYDSETE